jgi:6-phosphogluconolactonase
MSPPELLVVEDIPEAAEQLFLEASPRTIALSGGSTPKAAYERLAGISYPWEQVDVFLGDERCVPPDHPDSNFLMARDSLLDHVPARGHPMTDCDADAYERELRAVFGEGVPAFDFVFMGLGPDGHTASLFPGKPALEVTDRLVVYVPEPGMEPYHPRLTLTLPVFQNAKLMVYLVSGEDKRDRVRQLLDDADIPAARAAAHHTILLADPPAAPDPL